MDKQKSVSGYPFHNEETSMHPHSKIIRQDSETFIVEDENTIYEIDKHCAARARISAAAKELRHISTPA